MDYASSNASGQQQEQEQVQARIESKFQRSMGKTDLS